MTFAGKILLVGEGAAGGEVVGEIGVVGVYGYDFALGVNQVGVVALVDAVVLYQFVEVGAAGKILLVGVEMVSRYNLVEQFLAAVEIDRHTFKTTCIGDTQGVVFV